VTDTWQITLPWKRPPLTLNQRLAWPVKAGITKRVRRDVALLIRAHHIPPCGQVKVTLHWQPDTVRRRDGDNPIATLKPCIDGLRDAGVVVDDDISHVSFSEPVIHPVQAGCTARVWLEITRVPDEPYDH